MSEEVYCKLDQRIVFSSLWDEDGDTVKVWITLLALKNFKTGIVDKNITGIARICKLPIQKVEEAFNKFQSPDPLSSSQEFDGRRIQRVPEGWLVLNHERYTSLGWSEEKKEFERKRKAAWRNSGKKQEKGEAPNEAREPEVPDAPKTPKDIPPPRGAALMPASLSASPEFRLWWKNWMEHLRNKRSTPSIHAQQLQFAKLEAMGIDRAIAALKHSIECNWKGVFEPTHGRQGTLPKINTEADAVARQLREMEQAAQRVENL